MLGTAVSIVSISCLAVAGAGWPAAAGPALAQALSSALLMNVAIVGLNQLYDIEIDKVRFLAV
jgi:homogentisate phytyltransferase/homogentisate geranylgeranyltransferase